MEHQQTFRAHDAGGREFVIHVFRDVVQFKSRRGSSARGREAAF